MNFGNAFTKQLKARLRNLDGLQLQPIESGVGPIIDRRYSVSMSVAGAKGAFRELLSNPGKFSPSLIAKFKSGSTGTSIRQGSNLKVDLTAPLIAPVTVAKVSGDSFELSTLEGHPEAGTIRFGLEFDKFAEFYIHSVARSGFPTYDLLYLKLGIMKRIQTAMWVEFCRNFAREADGESASGTRISAITTYPDSTRLRESEIFKV